MMIARKETRFLVFLAVLFAVPAVVGRDEEYYKILGVSRDASTREIKKAYRALSMSAHPDRNTKDPNAEVKFQKINEAYEILSDPQKRAEYDQYGSEGMKKRQQQGGGGFPFGDMFGGGMNFNFGGFNFGGQGRGRERSRGPDVTVSLQVSLEDLYKGKTAKFIVDKQFLCSHCGGTGARKPSDIEKCPKCDGQGVRVVTHQVGPGFIQRTQEQCSYCDGTGQRVKAKCKKCGGTKVMRDEEEFTVIVERGMTDGQEIVFEHAGDQAPDTDPGNIIVRLHQLQHPRFTRKGNDLYFRMGITLIQALTGFKKHITHLDGHKVTISTAKVTKPGQVMEIKEEGMPIPGLPSGHGKLFVECRVIFPESLTKEQQAGLKKLLP